MRMVPDGLQQIVRMPLAALGGGGLQGGRPVQILDPSRVRRLLGVRRGGGVGGSAGQPSGYSGGGGSVGTPTYIPQNDPHDALIILNIHNWGNKKFFTKELAKVRPGGQVGGQTCFSVFFTHF